METPKHPALRDIALARMRRKRAITARSLFSPTGRSAEQSEAMRGPPHPVSPPHPALRATFSPVGRRGSAARRPAPISVSQVALFFPFNILAGATPLCPAGHLPLKGEERMGRRFGPNQPPFPSARHAPGERGKSHLPLSPLEGEMPGRAEGGGQRHLSAPHAYSPKHSVRSPRETASPTPRMRPPP
jgi:hypothetical protein